MANPVMKRAEGDGVKIQLAVWEGKGKNILCVHGLTANCRCWDVIAPALSPKHKVLGYDLRGRGLSDKPPEGYSEAQHIRDIQGLLDNLNLERTVLMGHSLGGYIALAFAALYPDRVAGLILLDAGGELSQDRWDNILNAIRPSVDRLEHIFDSADAYLNLMKLMPFLKPWSQAIETYFRYDMLNVSGGVRSRINPDHIREEISNKRQTDAARYYPKITCPVLILRATNGLLSEKDLLLPSAVVDKMLKEIPNARCENLSDTNHFSIIFQPNPDRDNAIKAFLEDLSD